MAGPDERIDIEVELENNLSKPAKVAEKSLDNLGDEATQVAGQMALLDENMEDVSRQARILAADAKYAQMALDGMGDAAQYSGKSTKEAAVGVEDYSKSTDKSTKSIDKNIKSMLRLTRITRMFRFALKALAIGAIIDGITMLVTAIQALGAAVAAAINGLARMSGVLAALPSLYASVAQGAMTFKIGVKGMGEALKLLGDPEATMQEINAAMQQLAPSARNVVKELFALSGGWEVLQRNVQQNLFAGLGDDVRVLGAKYLPILRTNLANTATELNNVMEYTSQWLQQGRNTRAVNSVMDDNRFIVGRLGIAMSNLFQATLHFMDAAGPMARRMSQDFEDWTQGFSSMIQENKGGIGEWLMGSYERWLKAKDALVDYGAAFFNIFKAATPMSNWMGRNIARIGREFRAWTESKQGRKEIKQFFKDMRPVVQELAYWVRDLSKFFAGIAMDPDVFVPLSKQMREELLPALEKIFDGLSGAVMPAVIELVEAFGELADAGLLEVFAKALLILAKALKAIAWAFNKMPDWAQNIIIWGGAIALLGRSKVMRGLLGFVGKTGVLAKFGGFLSRLLKGPMAAFAGWFEKTFGAKALAQLKNFLGPLGRILGKMAAFAAPGLLMGAAAGKGSKNAPTSKTGVPPVVATGPGSGKSTKGTGFKGKLGGAGRWIGGNAAWMAGFDVLFNKIPQGMGAVQGGNAAREAEGLRGSQQVYKALMESNVGQNADELGINVEKLAVSMAKYGEDSKYAAKVMEDLSGKTGVGGTAAGILPFVGTDDAAAKFAQQDIENLFRGVEDKMDLARADKNRSSTGLAKLMMNNQKIGKGFDVLTYKMKIATGTASQFDKKVAGLPDAVETQISTPGAIKSIDDVIALGVQYDLTPKEVATLLRTLDHQKAIRQATDTRKEMERFEGTYTATLEIKKAIDRAIGIATDPFNPNSYRFAGGQVQPNIPYTVGELGPEAFVSNTGRIGLLGEHGPELRKFSQGGAVIPSSATFNPQHGSTGNAPGWAVNAFRNVADDSMAHLSMGGGTATQTATEDVHYHYHQNGDVHNAQPIDMEREFKKAFRAMEREHKERR